MHSPARLGDAEWDDCLIGGQIWPIVDSTASRADVRLLTLGAALDPRLHPTAVNSVLWLPEELAQ